MRTRVGPTEASLYSLMKLAKGGIAPHYNTSPDMRAGPAQHNSKLIRVNLPIRSAHAAKNNSLSNHSKSDFVPPPVFWVIPVRAEHLQGYLDEFAFRFNRRKSRSRGKLFYRLAQQAVATEPSTYRQIADSAQAQKRA